jgi:hypothetical protein
MELLKEMKRYGFKIGTVQPTVKCQLFEDNSGAIAIATFPKARPRTKHLNNKLFHFRSYVDSGEISIQAIKTEDQPADFLTKPLNEDTFQRHRKTICGW